MSLYIVTEDGTAWVTIPDLVNWLTKYADDLCEVDEDDDAVRRITETLLLFDALRPEEDA